MILSGAFAATLMAQQPRYLPAEIDAGSLLDAIDRATAMLNQRSHHEVVEVWAGNRWIYRAGREKGFAN